MIRKVRRIRAATWATLAALAYGAMVSAAQSGAQAPGCRISGRVTTGEAALPLPGVSLVAYQGETATHASSTDTDGTYRLTLAPGAYRLTAQLTGFQPWQRDITVGGDPCDQTVELQLALSARTARAAVPPQAAAPAGRGAQRFETLAVQAQAGAAATAEAPASDREPVDAATRALLPPGFSTDAPTEAVAITGTMASLDRGMMTERFEAIGRGEFDPVTGEFREGAGRGGPGGPGEFGGRGGPGGFAQGGPGGRGGPGPGGRGGPGDFAIGGRGGRQNLYTGNASYTFGGSALDSTPYQLRADSPVSKRPYTRQTFNVSVGGPVRIPGVYNGTRRTNFNVTYGGSRGSNLFDQYATVPSEEMRGGDFSTASRAVIDPLTRQPFANNRIPIERMHPGARVLLGYIPLPNLPGTARNFHHVATAESEGDNLNLRITHNFTQAAAGRGGGRGGGGPIGRGGGRGGPGGRGQGTNVNLTAQLQYRRNDNEQLNALPTLGGQNAGSNLTVPVTLNVNHRRTLHNINISLTRSTASTTNRYAYVEDVAALAGITGVATDPFDWGVPALSFSSLSSIRDLTPTRRTDVRFASGYAWSRPMRNHTLRIGGDFRFDRSENQTDTNARGAFVFTGLYASGGLGGAPRGSGLDFADFLLGLPQQASVQYGPGNVRMNGRSMSLYAQDDWRKSAALTLNLGVRYELLWPFLEANGQMVNLDVAPDFSAVAPVLSGGAGAFTGAFPKSLMEADVNNLAPRVGFAWRIRPGNVLRGGYGISFNSGSYPTIARQMVGQPPFAVTNTSIGTLASPLTLSNPLATASPSETTNNYGVERDYALGRVQTWNADYARDLGQAWNVGGGYTHTRGASLDIVRAPNRGPSGLRIPGVQPFLWQTSEGASVLHAGTFRLLRRPVGGIGGGVTYTLARSRDNASTIGGGGTVVAQDDRNLEAEWGLSSFDRRHQLSMHLNLELPFGQNRPWLNRGGWLASVFENWRLNANFTWQSGTPFTPRVTGSATEIARGTNGTLRANYNGQPVRIPDPGIDAFFNTAAFSIPAAGTFGNATRNMIIGPGSRVLNAQLSRDLRLGGARANRSVGVQLNAANLLNTANYRAIDTVVNSPTFGQVTSVNPMRSIQLNVRVRF